MFILTKNGPKWPKNPKKREKKRKIEFHPGRSSRASYFIPEYSRAKQSEDLKKNFLKKKNRMLTYGHLKT